MEKSGQGFSNFMYYVIVMVYLTTFDNVIVLVRHGMCLKRLIDARFESVEPLHLLRLNGRVDTIPT